MMKIILNGKKVETTCKTMANLIAEKEIPLESVAIEVDGEVVPKSQLQEFYIKENSKIEIITFVGGG